MTMINSNEGVNSYKHGDDGLGRLATRVDGFVDRFNGPVVRAVKKVEQLVVREIKKVKTPQAGK